MSEISTIITGAGGMLGGRLAERLATLVDTALLYHHEPEKPAAEKFVIGELDDPEVHKQIREIGRPHVIINAAALTDVDLCQREPELSKRINALAPVRLAQASPDAKFVQISTDYVFPSQTKPPLPGDQAGPVNKYGEDKLAAEDHLLSLSANNLVVRISLNFDFRLQRGFFRHVFDTLSGGGTVHGITDQISNPCWSDSYAEMIVALLERNVSGIWHLGGRDFVSRYEFALQIADLFDFDKNKIVESALADHDRDAPRPPRSGLDCSETENLLDQQMPSLEESLKTIKSHYRK